MFFSEMFAIKLTEHLKRRFFSEVLDSGVTQPNALDIDAVSGNIYIGEFEKGKPHGKGKYI